MGINGPEMLSSVPPEYWRVLRRREWHCWVAKGILVSGMALFEHRRLGATLFTIGVLGTIVAHLRLDRFRCPRCGKSFARHDRLGVPRWSLFGNGYAALVWPVRKCVNCGFRRDARTWPSIEDEKLEREQARRELRRARRSE